MSEEHPGNVSFESHLTHEKIKAVDVKQNAMGAQEKPPKSAARPSKSPSKRARYTRQEEQ